MSDSRMLPSLEELGARRTETESYRDGKVDYYLVSETASFSSGIQRLVDGSKKLKIALMCSEKDPLTCHRTILVSRHLRDFVGSIQHILSDGKIESHKDAEMRLVKECKLQNQDFLVSDRERLELAYKRRGEKIAFEDNSNEGEADG